MLRGKHVSTNNLCSLSKSDPSAGVFNVIFEYAGSGNIKITQWN